MKSLSFHIILIRQTFLDPVKEFNSLNVELLSCSIYCFVAKSGFTPVDTDMVFCYRRMRWRAACSMIVGASAERIYCLKTINPELQGSLGVKSNLITAIVSTGGFTVPRPFVQRGCR